MATAEQLKRMNDINDLIKLIASIDRRTFYCKSKNRIAYFRFKKKLFFVDDYTGSDVYPYEMGYGRANGFSHGGQHVATGQQLQKILHNREMRRAEGL